MQPREGASGTPPARGVGSLLRGAAGVGAEVAVPAPDGATVAPPTLTPALNSQPATEATPAGETVATPATAGVRQPVWPFVLADLALVAMAGFLMNPGRRAMTATEATVCVLAMLIAAWLGCLGIRAAATNQRIARAARDPFKP